MAILASSLIFFLNDGLKTINPDLSVAKIEQKGSAGEVLFISAIFGNKFFESVWNEYIDYIPYAYDTSWFRDDLQSAINKHKTRTITKTFLSFLFISFGIPILFVVLYLTKSAAKNLMQWIDSNKTI